ncbi:MAG: hypothetical protein WCS30_07845 [Selenomonadaceae bacterium]
MLGINVQALKAKMKYQSKTYAEVARALGMNRDTFARHLGKTGDFKISAIHKMMEIIPLNMEEVQFIFFSKK